MAEKFDKTAGGCSESAYLPAPFFLMVISFVLLVAASVLFRYLAFEAGVTFEKRTRALMPRNVGKTFVKTLFAEFREQLPAFRTQALPMQGLRLVLDTLACGTFVLGFWSFPPAFIKGFDLWSLRDIGTGVVAVAFVADAFAFLRMAYSARVLESAPCDAEPEA